MNRLRVADLFTLGNLAAGFFAVLSDDILVAAGLICLGAFLDVFDGWVARRMNQSSNLGIQLDSMADMVTFGIAPAVLFYNMLPEGGLSLVISVCIPLASAWRLATFNLLPPSPWFQGVPTPTNALWYVGLSLWLTNSTDLPNWLTNPYFHMSLSLIMSTLMVTTLPIPGVKSLTAMRGAWWVLLLAIMGLLVPVIMGFPLMAINTGITFFLGACALYALKAPERMK